MLVNLDITLSQDTLFIFKEDSERPRVFIPIKITSISRHQHIKTTTKRWCLICRNSEGTQTAQIANKESIVYGTILKLLEKTLEEVIPSKKDIKRLKRIRGTKTFWKYSECIVPLCRPEKPCWDITHKRLFNK